jgi:dipeptidyl aminopeptidase/acylaminoacyl peptidase
VSISRSEKLIRLSISSPVSPGDLYINTIGEDELIRLTHTLNAEIDENDLVAAEVIRYPSYDGLEIPAILYKPHEATSKNKVPAVLWIHGGPGGQSRLGFSSTIQYLVNHGYVILAVNNRGSSGYGKTFYMLDNQRHGEDDLMDCVKAKDFLATLGYVDMDRVGIMGGSYGGYMTMAALTYHPEEFAVGVNVFGVTNWLRTLRSIPPYWEAFKKQLYDEMGDPNTADSVRLRKISPLFHAENVTKPLMVLQGANDPRVLQVESDEIVEAVRKNGIPVEYVIFEDEGHGFMKKENRIEGYGKVKVFLDTYLKGDGPATE